jgi:CRISPR-associated RAMP protein (TIGR02581 family)
VTEFVPTFETLHSRVQLDAQVIPTTGLRIGAGRDSDVAGHDLPVMRSADGRPFIPGSSFKGVLRASLEAALRSLADDAAMQTRLACLVLIDDSNQRDPAQRDPVQRCVTNADMERWRDELPPDQLTTTILQHSCLICQTFGSPWLASHVVIADLPVDPTLWVGQFEVRQGVALDRDTSTARDAHLYSFETVPPGTPFTLRLQADNLAPWQCGLLWLGLQPFIRGEISLGGARSRGLGQVQLLAPSWQVWQRGAGDDRISSVLALLRGRYASVSERTYEQWQDALHTRLMEVTRA